MLRFIELLTTLTSIVSGSIYILKLISNYHSFLSYFLGNLARGDHILGGPNFLGHRFRGYVVNERQYISIGSIFQRFKIRLNIVVKTSMF